MRKFIVLIVFLFNYSFSSAQEHLAKDLLVTDDTWGKELFVFPIGFAPDLAFEGTEDARFPKGWSQETSPDFWSYAFAWNIKLTKPLSEKEIAQHLETYFDGLMQVVNKDKSITIPKTNALFIKKESKKATMHIGKVKLYDAFTKKKVFTLNATVEQYYCKKQGEMQLLFRFSPQTYDHEIWNQLNAIVFRSDLCNK